MTTSSHLPILLKNTLALFFTLMLVSCNNGNNTNTTDSTRSVKDSTLIFNDADTTFLQGSNEDSIFLEDSLADTIAFTKDTISTTKHVATITCNNCGNYVAKSSRKCPACGKNPMVSRTHCFD